MKIGINCGHTLTGTIGGGASGYLDESKETRAVGYALMELLRKAGHTIVDCTNDRASSVNENLSEICRLANAQPLDMFLSIHLNAGGGQGTEIFTYGGIDKANAGKILKSLVDLGFKNRGIKDGKNLYVVRRSNAPACLLEVCFVDTATDAMLYNKLGAERIARAIAETITENKIESEDLTLSQYEELKNTKQDKPFIYNYIDDNMPEWAKPTIQKLVDKGILKGDDNGLNLTEDLMRILVINDRAGLYD